MDTSVANPTIIRLPTIAFASPPPGVPGAGVLLVKKSQLSAVRPLNASVHSIHSRPIRPTAIDTLDSSRPIALTTFRRRYRPASMPDEGAFAPMPLLRQAPARRVPRAVSQRAIASTMKVIANSSSPSANSEGT